jgi:hypothetical protein
VAPYICVTMYDQGLVDSARAGVSRPMAEMRYRFNCAGVIDVGLAQLAQAAGESRITAWRT